MPIYITQYIIYMSAIPLNAGMPRDGFRKILYRTKLGNSLWSGFWKILYGANPGLYRVNLGNSLSLVNDLLGFAVCCDSIPRAHIAQLFPKTLYSEELRSVDFSTVTAFYGNNAFISGIRRVKERKKHGERSGLAP